MAKRKSFSDDGWAIWITGEDTSTLYLNEWVNPQGKSYVDVSVRIRGIKKTQDLNIYIPFKVNGSEIEDLSHYLKNENVFRAIFSTRYILDYMKNYAICLRIFSLYMEYNALKFPTLSNM